VQFHPCNLKVAISKSRDHHGALLLSISSTDFHEGVKDTTKEDLGSSSDTPISEITSPIARVERSFRESRRDTGPSLVRYEQLEPLDRQRLGILMVPNWTSALEALIMLPSFVSFTFSTCADPSGRTSPEQLPRSDRLGFHKKSRHSSYARPRSSTLVRARPRSSTLVHARGDLHRARCERFYF